MLKYPVKASQITNLTDARYFAAREASWLGFNLDSGVEQAVSPQLISAIKEWVEGPKIVLEFGLQSPEEIKMAVEYLKIDAVQISMFADTEALFKTLSVPIIKEVVIENEDLAGIQEFINSQSQWVDIFILDLAKNDLSLQHISEETRSMLSTLCQNTKILFNINSSVEMLFLFLEQVKPLGLVLLGGDEEKVGFKSFDELDEILDRLEIE